MNEYRPSWMDEDWFEDDTYTVFELPDEKPETKQLELFEERKFK